ncbi:MAG: hypothetical protein AAFY10_03160 [Pseudomonadota bacterium]
MRNMLLLAGLVLAIGGCVSTSAQSSQVAEAPAHAADEPTRAGITLLPVSAGDEKICRTDKMMGSRIRDHTVCLTKREWADLEQANHRFMHENVTSEPHGGP